MNNKVFVISTETEDSVFHQYHPVTAYLCKLNADSYATSPSQEKSDSFMNNNKEKVTAMMAKVLTLTNQSFSHLTQLITVREKELEVEGAKKQVKKEQSTHQKSSNKWLSLNYIELSTSDKNTLSRGQWLNDKHIAMAHELIKYQFPVFNGFMCTLQQRSKPLPETTNALQIIHIRESHWALMSTIDCSPGEVKLYDSIYLKVSADTETIIAKLLHTNAKAITENYECGQAGWSTRLCPFCNS